VSIYDKNVVGESAREVFENRPAADSQGRRVKINGWRKSNSKKNQTRGCMCFQNNLKQVTAPAAATALNKILNDGDAKRALQADAMAPAGGDADAPAPAPAAGTTTTSTTTKLDLSDWEGLHHNNDPRYLKCIETFPALVAVYEPDQRETIGSRQMCLALNETSFNEHCNA
jgi:hypothetical protein